MLAPFNTLTVVGATPGIVRQAFPAFMDAALRAGIIGKDWKPIYTAARHCTWMYKVVGRLKDSIGSPHWSTVVSICNAVQEFQKVLARRPSGAAPNSPPDWLYVTHREERTLEIQIEIMKAGLQFSRYNPDALDSLESEITLESHKLKQNIRQRVTDLEQKADELRDIIGNTHSAALRLAIEEVEIGGRRAARWWHRIDQHFSQAKWSLNKALKHPKLRKSLIVCLPVRTARSEQDTGHLHVSTD
jgi:hypothetical protein